MLISLFDRVENMVGKRGKCWLPAFSPFLTMLSKGSLQRVLKTKGLFGKELMHLQKESTLESQHRRT